MPARSLPARLAGALLAYGVAAPAFAEGGAAVPCEDLSALSLPNTSIRLAERVASGSFSPPGGGAAQTGLRGREVLAAFYGRRPEYSYWNGCSEGGREGLMEAQRLPEDFDGVLVGAPAQFFTHLQAGGVWNQQALQGDPAATIPASKAPAIQAAALAQCDLAGDRLQDGVVGDARACALDPSVLLCAGEETDPCLTARQVTALTRVYQGAHNPRTGTRLFTGHQPGAEADPSANWNFWFWSGPEAGQFVLGDALFKYFVHDDPDWDWRSFDFDRDMAYADSKPIDGKPLGWVMNAVNPGLRRFAAHRGRIIQYHGLNDPAIAPYSITYYEFVPRFEGRGEGRDARGAGGHRRGALRRVQEFYRYYNVPGMGHCTGGPGANAFGQQGSPAVPADPEHDALLALRRWVEEGVAPEAIVATKYNNNAPSDGVQFTRPLCPYPQTATYKREGDPADAASFACVGQDLSPENNLGLAVERLRVSPDR